MTGPTFPDQLNLADYYLFDREREGLGDDIAIRYGDRSWTYAEVADRSRRFAAALARAGVSPEQRVYIVLPDTPPFAWALFGILARGAVVAMGNPAAPDGDLSYVVDYSRAAAVVITESAAAKVSKALAESPFLKQVYIVPDTATGEDPEAPCQIPAGVKGVTLRGALDSAVGDGSVRTRRDDIAFWLFTSGSTGRPKAALHSHRDFAFNTEVYAKGTVGYRRGDVTVSVPNLYFGYATGTNLLFPFAVGATAALFSERPTAESVAGAIERYQPTVVTNVPTMIGKLLDLDDERKAAGQPGLDMSSVRFHLSAGEALPPALLDRFTDRFGAEVYDGIGSAEMFHIYISNRPGDVKPASLGRRVDGYELKILPASAAGPGADEVADGETGVLWVRGDSVAHGYFQDRDKSWKTFHGHWCRTGDLFRRDADGYYWFEGRADDLFKVGGIWVAPREVEDCLMGHEAVALAAVVPVEIDGLTKPKAFVVPKPERKQVLDDDSLRTELVAALQGHCKERLSKHKYPRLVEV
ncbi:MAG: benzoate-CoA ligase family protein, partial [Deltaproteobacteria bacterium]|nr:benzoate-CoA ligase family protein [Deltaproteobacteria bacterium]